MGPAAAADVFVGVDNMKTCGRSGTRRATSANMRKSAATLTGREIVPGFRCAQAGLH
jgi:hypothetical protein